MILALTLVSNIVLNMMSGVTPASFFRTVLYNWQDVLTEDFRETESFRTGLELTLRDLIAAPVEADASWLEEPWLYSVDFLYADGAPVEDEPGRMGYWQDEWGNWYTSDGEQISDREVIARIAAGMYASTTVHAPATTTAVATTTVPAVDTEDTPRTEAAKKNVFTLNSLGSAPGILYYSENALDPDFVCTNLTDRGVDCFQDAKELVKELRHEYRYLYVIEYGTAYYYLDGIPATDPGLDEMMNGYHRNGNFDIMLVMAGDHYDVFGEIDAELWSVRVSDQFSRLRSIRASLIVMGAMLALIVILAPAAFLLRRHRRAFYDWLLTFLGKVWLELKVAFALVTGWCTIAVLASASDQYQRTGDYAANIGAAILMMRFFIGCYVLGVLIWELAKNPQSRRLGLWDLACRLGRRAGALLRRIEAMYPLQRAMTIRAIATGAAILFLFFVLWVVGEASRYLGSLRSFFRFLIVTAFLVLLLLWFFRGYARMIKGIGQVMDSARDIRAGKLDTTLAFPEDHELHLLADDLTNIGEGLQTAETERFRAERMKVELVTNISHDLKTPLTSIISYAGLLRDLSLEAPAGEYVDVICKKADRLDRLTRDLFEVSRAQSGNLPLNLERIDFAAHIRQSMAELDERIAASGLDFRVKMPETPVWIIADGQKLYRVIENLVVNAVKYAMSGTRVWVSLKCDADVVFEIKNIASYEMNFDGAHITERFVRGDESRTGEGTGLGLAIARSFTESCGGTFTVDVDGDVFRVTMRFDKAE